MRKSIKNYMNKFFTLLIITAGFIACSDKTVVERMTSRGEGLVDEYVASFNATDDELYIQEFDNSEAADFMKANVPYFECPDKELEKTYYYRWWTFRKHVKSTPEASDMTKEEIASYMGELYFLRAFCYWNLVRTFGSVPLRTEENMYTWDLAKSPVADVYELIVSDLKKAMENCPDKARYYGTPCKNSAKALYAWVCLDLKEYGEAKKYAGEVIASGSYSLVQVTSGDDFATKVFGEGLPTTSEEVFYLKTSMTDSKTWDYLVIYSTSSV